MTSPEVLAYCAGVIDSDGSIGVRRSTYSMRVRKESTQPIYSVRICAKQVSPEAVTLLQKTFGGSLMLQSPSVTRGKSLWYWEVHSRQGAQCLRQLLPFLRIKRAQAENGLALYDLVERSRAARCAAGWQAKRPIEITALMEQAYLRSKELNAVGVGERR